MLGSTGAVGSEVLRQALGDRRISRVLAVTRRPLRITDSRLQQILLDDFADWTPLAPALAGIDAVVCALGMAWPQAESEAQYRRVTFEYVMAAARVIHEASPEARFCFVSGHGASRTSRQTWARIKAETEDALQGLLGERLTVFRPGYIYPVHGRESSYWGDTIMRPFVPFSRLMPRFMTDTVTVARALLHVAHGAGVASPMDNVAITRAAARFSGQPVKG